MQDFWANREDQHALKENSSISSMPTNRPKPANKGFTQLQGKKGIHSPPFTWLLFSLKVVNENVRQCFPVWGLSVILQCRLQCRMSKSVSTL